MLALTGTPLINDVEDFDAIWRFLGWTNGEKPGCERWEVRFLMKCASSTTMPRSPSDPSHARCRSSTS
jgi:hypothetical protein